METPVATSLSFKSDIPTTNTDLLITNTGQVYKLLNCYLLV